MQTRIRNVQGVLASGFVLATLGSLSSAHADMVTDWNANTVAAVRAASQPPPVQGRFLAIVHTAIYDAVNGIQRRYSPYFVTERGPRGASPEAAAAQAGYTALVNLFPAQKATLDAQLAASLAIIPGHRGRSRCIELGRAWGDYVATRILDWRSGDGFSTPAPLFFGEGTAGVWRSPPTATDPDGTLPAIFPQMATLVPFAMASPSQFRPGPPPPLASALYATDFNEVKAIGRFDSAVRTDEQTQLALLWQAIGLIDENVAAASVVPRRLCLIDSARLFALLNIAACDATIAGFDSKYTYNFWRPYHAIRFADADGNPDTMSDPDWNSLFLPPRFQEYVSNHAIITGAMMRVLTRLLGDRHSLTLSSPGQPGVSATVHRFSDATSR